MTKLIFASMMMLASFFGLAQVNTTLCHQLAQNDIEMVANMRNQTSTDVPTSDYTKAMVYWTYLGQLNESGQGNAVTKTYETFFAEALRSHSTATMKQHVETFEKSFSEYAQSARSYGHTVMGVNL